jgi:hypothetical protein
LVIVGKEVAGAAGAVVQGHSIAEGEQYPYQRLLDMLRKLRLETSPGRAYDATLFLLARPSATDSAELVIADVPRRPRPEQFYESLLKRVFERLPVSERVAARQLYGRRELPTTEVAGQTGAPIGPVE